MGGFCTTAMLRVTHLWQFNKKIPQPPYSPDIAPCDFWLFPNLKFRLKGERFASIEVIKANVLTKLRAIAKEGYQRCFQQLQIRWSKCVFLRKVFLRVIS